MWRERDKIIAPQMSSDLAPTPEPMEADSASAAGATAIRDTSAGWLRLSHTYTALTATLLLMASTILSRVIGLVREKYIAHLFGAGQQTDAYRAAFQLPEMINYFLVGGVASVAFVTILSRYREQGREHEGEAALASILTMMLAVLGGGIVAAEIFARSYVAWWFNGFTPETIALTTHMTRILLPVQLFFFVGGVLGSVLLVRKQFAYQAVTPLIYNLGIIFGGLVFARRFGVSGLALGAVMGVIAGPFALNLLGVRRAGFKVRLSLRWGHPGLREWVRLQLPLILGVSLVTFDTWIMNHFASHGQGQIACLNFAKTLFTAPMAVLGMAAGAASMPFFAALIGKGRMEEFAATVNGTVTRIVAVSLLGSAWMMGLAQPVVNVLLRGGALHQRDATLIAMYFTVFAVSLLCWSAQSIYFRAFCAAGNTLTPMIASSLIVITSVPMYSALYRTHGALGLAMASNIGILAQTLAMAVLLDRNGLVRLGGLEWGELGRALAASAASLGALLGLRHVLPPQGGLVANAAYLLAGTVVWIAVSWLLLGLMGSRLPHLLLSRLRRRKTPPA
jgi:putative peptidoglycan lipid II flippase